MRAFVRNQYGTKKVPDDFGEVLALYGEYGRWEDVATHYGVARSTLKNAMGNFLALHGFNSASQAIWYLFVKRERKHEPSSRRN